MKTTKQLARELGLIRERKLNSTSGERSKQKKQCQDFSYLIVIDFESTCWERDKTKTQEIIEFPAVLLNTKTGEIESEFHYYVQPQEHPTLSAFCQKLTGISQEQVENGIPLSLCLRKFSHWLHTLSQGKNICLAGDMVGNRGATAVNLAAIVTWSDWDLGVCLHYELKRKQITKAPCFNQWIDLRATYTKFYGRKPKGLNGALQDVGIEFEGREHSGLHDARNTATLAWRMMRDGCIITITKSLVPISANTGGCPHTNTKQFKKKMTPRKETPWSKSVAGKREQSNTAIFVDPKYSESISISGSKTKNETASHCEPGAGLRMRHPNIPQSLAVKNGTDRRFDAAQKRPAMFTPEKSSSTKCPRLSTPKRSAQKTSSNCMWNKSENAEAISVSSHAALSASQGLSMCMSKPTPSFVQYTNVCSASVVTVISNGRPTSSVPVSTFKANADGVSCSGQNIRVRSIIPTLVNKEQCIQNTAVSSNDAVRTATGSSCQVPNGKLQGSRLPIPVSRKHSPLQQNGVNEKAPAVTCSSFRTPSPLTDHCSRKSNICHNPAMVSSCTSSVQGAHMLSRTTAVNGQTIKPSSSSASFRTPQNCVRPPTSIAFITPQNPTATSFKTAQNPVRLSTRTASLRTPQNSVPPPVCIASFRTPQNTLMTTLSTMKATPPLCKCGRRAKRRMVQNPGPNMGRWFFSCVKGTANSTNTKSAGCGFFQWEHAIKIRSAASVTPVGRKTYQSKTTGVGIARPFTPVLQAPGTGQRQRGLGVTSTSTSSFR